MGVKKLDKLVAFLPALDFKRRVYAIVRRSPEARLDLRFRSQLFEAARSVEFNIAEGWKRFRAGEMAQFLRFALASLEEAKRGLHDGVDLGYFTDADCAEALVLADRCGAATMALWKSLQPFVKNPRNRTQ